MTDVEEVYEFSVLEEYDSSLDTGSPSAVCLGAELAFLVKKEMIPKGMTHAFQLWCTVFPFQTMCHSLEYHFYLY